MKKFKDFLYDKNDILIAVGILAIAALVIMWRLDIILEYPKELVAENNNPSSSQQTPDLSEATGTDTEKPSGTDVTDPQDTPVQPASLWEGGVLTKEVEVDVEGNSASAAVNCLIEAGLFEDYADYENTCKDAGLDHEKVKAGTFTFKSGYTKKDIAKDVNWG